MIKYRFEILDKSKEYIEPGGRLKNMSRFLSLYDGTLLVSQKVENNPCVVRTDSTGYVFDTMELLSRWKEMAVTRATISLGMKEEDVDFGETVEDALAKLTEIYNTPEKQGVSEIERLAAEIAFNSLAIMQNQKGEN